MNSLIKKLSVQWDLWIGKFRAYFPTDSVDREDCLQLMKGAEISLEKEEAYREIYLPELTLIDGLEPFLNALQAANIPMAIGTAAPPGNLNFVSFQWVSNRSLF